MTKLIQATEVAFSYGSQRVLNGVTTTINAGEIIGLIGENGAGKTTFLNLLLGVTQVASGHLQLFGQHPGASAVKARIGSMLQGDILVQGVTVQEMLQLAAAQYDHPLVITDLLASLELTPLAHRRLNALSGGQLRRVTFAVALVGDPELLFLDEPTVGMDTNAQRAFWHRIADLKEQGKTIIITSHYLPEIQDVADRILLLKAGQLAFQGTFQALQARYQQVVITAQTPLPVAPFAKLPAVTLATKQADTLTLQSNDGDRTLLALVPSLKALHQLTIERESLADIFVHLTREEQ